MQDSAEGEGAPQSFYLPAQVSGFVLMTLCGICSEINRAAGLVEKGLMIELASTLSSQFLRCYEQLLDKNQPEPISVSQDGAVQLLFDINFISDVFSARAFGNDPEENKNFNARLETVRSQLKELIDPFDLIVYERPLQESRARYYIRCEVLLGNFLRLNRLYTGIKPSAIASDRDNMISLAPVVAKFPLLPISSLKVDPTQIKTEDINESKIANPSLSFFEQLFDA